MAIKVTRENWNNKTFKDATLIMSELLGEDIVIQEPKPKPYNAQIWKNDDIVFERDFDNRKDALKWIKTKLSKEKNAYADLKKYNKSRDDFDWWFLRLNCDKLEDFTNESMIG